MQYELENFCILVLGSLNLTIKMKFTDLQILKLKKSKIFQFKYLKICKYPRNALKCLKILRSNYWIIENPYNSWNKKYKDLKMLKTIQKAMD